MYRIHAVVREVTGKCHAGYRKGHQITFERPRVVLKETDCICMWAFQAILPFVATLSSEIVDSHTRIHKHGGDHALKITYLRCPDPGPVCSTGGGSGSVLFELVREEIEPSSLAADGEGSCECEDVTFVK